MGSGTMTAPASQQQAVLLHPLHIGEIEDGAAEVGRPETGVFISLPLPGVEIIRDLQKGHTLKEVSRTFAERYGEPPDLVDFLATLSECGFVREEGAEVSLPARTSAPQMNGWQLLASLPTTRVAWLVSRPARIVWAAVWLAVPIVLILRPDLIPTAADGRLGVGVAADAVLLTVLGWSLVFLHEVAHLVAVRARGCTGVLRLSHRLHLLVAETDISAVRSLPRSQRYAPYLAGMTLTIAVFGMTLVARLADLNAQPIPAIGYLCLVTLLFELAFFLRTDMYYVIVTGLRLGNLMADTWHWIGNQIAHAVHRPEPYDLSAVPARELRIVRWYSMVLVAGVGVVIGQFLVLGLPLLVSFIRDAVSKIQTGPATVGFWDAAVLLLLTAAHFGTLGFVAVSRRLRPVTEVAS